ncbi:hypothetical protein [Polaromonas sp. YR568]|uniref:hypothetical protein n=1 Tax=Polaromonas sp. YR568 TaxID=1855301 RepID=UPI003138388F
MIKEYGKLTAGQFHEFIGAVPGLLEMLRGMNEQLASTSAVKFDSVMPGDYGLYSYVYEMPFAQHLSFVVVGLNRMDEVKAMAASPDPQQAVLNLMRDRDAVDDREQHPDFDDEDIVTLAYSLGRTIQSMATYGRSISSLLQDVRENNNHDSLFKAIRMDRAVIGCPTAMKSIARAQIRGNKAFFKSLRSALAGPSKKEWAGLDQMRYAFVMLREMGLNDLSEAALEELMVDKLQVYKAPKGDARKNLRAHYRQSRKIKTI